MAVTEEGREKWLPLVIVPGAGDIIDITRVPWEVAQNNLLHRGPGDFRGLNRTQIPRLRPGPVCRAPDMPHTDVIEPKCHIVADAIRVPAGFYIHILRVSVVCGTMEHVQGIRNILVQW